MCFYRLLGKKNNNKLTDDQKNAEYWIQQSIHSKNNIYTRQYIYNLLLLYIYFWWLGTFINFISDFNSSTLHMSIFYLQQSNISTRYLYFYWLCVLLLNRHNDHNHLQKHTFTHVSSSYSTSDRNLMIVRPEIIIIESELQQRSDCFLTRLHYKFRRFKNTVGVSCSLSCSSSCSRKAWKWN